MSTKAVDIKGNRSTSEAMDNLNLSPEKTIYSPRIKTMLMSQVEKIEPIEEHDTFEDETLEQFLEMRERMYKLSVKGSPSYHGCFDYGVRPDMKNIGTYDPINAYLAEQQALEEGRIPIKLVQKKYHPHRPFDNDTGETYLEQIGTPMYEENGIRFDIPN